MPYQLEDFRRESKLIKEVHSKFRVKYVRYAKNIHGMINIDHVDKIIQSEIYSARLTMEQSAIVDSFFDSYVGALFIGNFDIAESFVKTCLGD